MRKDNLFTGLVGHNIILRLRLEYSLFYTLFNSNSQLDIINVALSFKNIKKFQIYFHRWVSCNCRFAFIKRVQHQPSIITWQQQHTAEYFQFSQLKIVVVFGGFWWFYYYYYFLFRVSFIIIKEEDEYKRDNPHVHLQGEC